MYYFEITLQILLNKPYYISLKYPFELKYKIYKNNSKSNLHNRTSLLQNPLHINEHPLWYSYPRYLRTILKKYVDIY